MPQRLTTHGIHVGHLDVRVKACGADVAIALARQQMARDLPRLYDVTRDLTAARSEVELY